MKDLFNLFGKPIRTGTRLVIINWYISIGIVVFLNIILPIIGLWQPIVAELLGKLNVSNTTVALLGQSALTTIGNELRKAVENKK